MTTPITSPASLLRAARALIQEPEHWTKGAEARDHWGSEVSIGDENACRFCLVGSLYRSCDQPATDGVGAARIGAAREAVRQAIRQPSISAFNDAIPTTHADVLAALDRAIALCETRGAPGVTEPTDERPAPSTEGGGT